MTARETLDFTVRFFLKGPEAEIQNRIEETIELVGLSDKADRPIKTFSGGERQRLGIAQAQVNYPDLLILDEPAASLDPLGRRDVLAVMERLRKYATVLYCTHILGDVERVSDTVAILDHGELVSHGPISELLVGSGGTTYIARIGGDADAARDRVLKQSWVNDVHTTVVDGDVSLVVVVSDPIAADAQLARLILADEHMTLTDFRRKTYELEEVFLEIVEGGQNVGQ